ncbi:uncharacterized protein LOC124165281 isoform X2 [Ischnura elegans]|uniref:uncharacterized protein LOC124165281 isoform X2 n=1 Tax=Ischnura elegans TaxID=197161 RepID=UPI001ED888F5|nr:uncharacterized protein LOC124165281 isoform X2 [Ischnura elegans]
MDCQNLRKISRMDRSKSEERRIEQAKKIHVKGLRDHESRRGLIPIQRLSIPSKSAMAVGATGGSVDGPSSGLAGNKDSGSLHQLKRENQPLVEWDTDESEEEIHFFPVSSSAGKGGNIAMGRQVLTDTFSIEGLDLSGEDEEEEDDDDEDDLNLVPPKLHYQTCTCCVLPISCGCAIM